MTLQPSAAKSRLVPLLQNRLVCRGFAAMAIASRRMCESRGQGGSHGISRDLQILELSGLHLDRSITGCGDATLDELRVAVEARLIALRQAFQAAMDRRVELVVLHSEILSSVSTAGRAPWFLARQIEACGERGIPVVWIERQHNDWMARFVDAPSHLTGCTPARCG